MQTIAPDRYLSPAQVADHFGVTVQTIKRWLRDGDLEGVRLGTGRQRHIRIRESDVASFVTPLHPHREATNA
jgi:excisionase family DNA binding protein